MPPTKIAKTDTLEKLAVDPNPSSSTGPQFCSCGGPSSQSLFIQICLGWHVLASVMPFPRYVLCLRAVQSASSSLRMILRKTKRHVKDSLTTLEWSKLWDSHFQSRETLSFSAANPNL